MTTPRRWLMAAFTVEAGTETGTELVLGTPELSATGVGGMALQSQASASDLI